MKRSRNRQSPLYSQISIEKKVVHDPSRSKSLDNSLIEETRNSEIRRFFSKPSPSFLSTTLNVLIFESLHLKYNLGPAFPEKFTEKAINEQVEALLKTTGTCSHNPCIC